MGNNNYSIYRRSHLLKGIHFSCVYLYGVMLLLSVIISLHFWFKDLIREFYKKYEVLLMVLFLAYLIFDTPKPKHILSLFIIKYLFTEGWPCLEQKRNQSFG